MLFNRYSFVIALFFSYEQSKSYPYLYAHLHEPVKL